jgi:3-deoxy-D-manno-octulosonate 8-phosphate phosphatase (KDO 8-P phosphatase)
MDRLVAVRNSQQVITAPVLSREELRRRAAKLKFVLTDCDGVLTDTGVYYSHNGEELRRFSVRDGMGVQRLRDCGIETAIISKENSLAIRKRAEKLVMRQVYLGVTNKLAMLPEILAQNQFELDQLAYIGDDVNDLEIIEAIGQSGLAAAPSDAMEQVQTAVHYLTSAPAGHGAFRDFAEWIIGLRADSY